MNATWKKTKVEKYNRCVDDTHAGKVMTYIKMHVSCIKLYGPVSAEIQNQQGDWHFLHDCGDVKAAGITGRCVCLRNLFTAWFRKLGRKEVVFSKP